MGYYWIFVMHVLICITQRVNSQFDFNPFLQSQFPSMQPAIQTIQPSMQQAIQQTMQAMQPTMQAMQQNIQAMQPSMQTMQQNMQAMQPTMQAMQPTMQAMQPPQQNYYPQQPITRYQGSSYRESRRRSSHHLRARDSSNYDYDSFEDSDCINYCSCETCLNPTPCCQPVCDACLAYQPPKQQGIFLVPYPYPVILKHSSNSSDTSNHTDTKKSEKPHKKPMKASAGEATDTSSDNEKESSAQTTIQTTTSEAPKTTFETPNKPKPIPQRVKMEPQPKTNDKFVITINDSTQKSKSKRTTVIPIKIVKPLDSEDWSMPEETTAHSQLLPYNKARFGETNTNINVLNDLLFKNHMKSFNNNNDFKGNKFVMSSMRKMQPGWEPKYGIVPIPDELALDLMEQLRNIKLLQAQRHASKFIKNTRKAYSNPFQNLI